MYSMAMVYSSILSLKLQSYCTGSFKYRFLLRKIILVPFKISMKNLKIKEARKNWQPSQKNAHEMLLLGAKS